VLSNGLQSSEGLSAAMGSLPGLWPAWRVLCALVVISGLAPVKGESLD
jgi:hypothetical protein